MFFLNRIRTRKKILEAYTYWQDNLERRLAAVIAAKQKMAEQMERDNKDAVITTPTVTTPLDE